MSERLHDVAVVGAGLAGMSAALFAGARGLDTVQVGNAGALLFSSGLLDVLGVHPVTEGRVWADPWAALDALRADEPLHPYRCLPPAAVRQALAEVVTALGEVGLDYGPPGDRNVEVVTCEGTVKETCSAPRTMLVGAEAFAAKRRCLLVDFRGQREVSARAIAESLGERWPGIRPLRVDFPGTTVAGEAYAAHVARALELCENRARLAELVRPHVGDAEVVGFPAVLGLRRTERIAADLAERLGVPVFELPTIPTSVPGLRLKDALERAVAQRGVQRLVHGHVVAVDQGPDGFALHLRCEPWRGPLRARALVLATGRFMGGGLVADRRAVREPVMGLPVVQPPTRADWHRRDLFDPSGHPLNRAGIAVDDSCRPVRDDGSVVHPRLFAAGTVLAHQDWIRAKCGAGVAVATAAKAIAVVCGDGGDA
jgi:glycerol-3-phosphate dehydrogenase subunit B